MLMSLGDFKNWAIAQGSVGKYPDSVPAGADNFMGQCVSLINQFCWRSLNVPAKSWGNAIVWATNKTPQSQYFDYVSGPPKAGDILVYGTPYGKGVENGKTVYYGHIEIALDGSNALHQNRNNDGKVRTSSILPGYIAVLRIKGGFEVRPYNKGDAFNIAQSIGAPQREQELLGKKDWNDAAYAVMLPELVFRINQVKELSAALDAERNRPPKEVIKEVVKEVPVEKVVEKIVKVPADDSDRSLWDLLVAIGIKLKSKLSVAK